MGMDKSGGGTDFLGPFRKPQQTPPLTAAGQALAQPTASPYQVYQQPDNMAAMAGPTPMSPAMETEQQRRRRALGPYATP